MPIKPFGRAAGVAVSTDAIQEALENIYPAPALVAELNGR